jgi:hypothetical protein
VPPRLLQKGRPTDKRRGCRSVVLQENEPSLAAGGQSLGRDASTLVMRPVARKCTGGCLGIYRFGTAKALCENTATRARMDTGGSRSPRRAPPLTTAILPATGDASSGRDTRGSLWVGQSPFTKTLPPLAVVRLRTRFRSQRSVGGENAEVKAASPRKGVQCRTDASGKADQKKTGRYYMTEVALKDCEPRTVFVLIKVRGAVAIRLRPHRFRTYGLTTHTALPRECKTTSKQAGAKRPQCERDKGRGRINR